MQRCVKGLVKISGSTELTAVESLKKCYARHKTKYVSGNKGDGVHAFIDQNTCFTHTLLFLDGALCLLLVPKPGFVLSIMCEQCKTVDFQ